jgi:hypothetical protein
MVSMHFRESRTALTAALIVTLGLAVTACSSSNTPSTKSSTPAHSATPTSTPTSSGEPTSGSGAVAAIKANWATFFNAKTPNSHRIALLQNGSDFTAVINAQSKSLLAKEASSKATAVTLTGTTTAGVTYEILVSGSPVLKDQPGEAVYQDGVWKVGVVSFCGLLKLENSGKTSGLPAACKG